MKLFDFQREALENVKGKKRVAFYYDMGLGKTYLGSEKAIELDNPVTLVVCQKSKVKDWKEHFEKHYGVWNRIYDLTNKDDFEWFKTGAIHPFNVIGIINYDLLIRRPELMKLKGFTLLVDESQALQNEKSKRTKFISKMNFDACILLSGTPVSGRYEQLVAQAKLLGWNITKKEFWNQFVQWRDWKPAPWVPPIPIVIGYKNVDYLKMCLRQHGAQFKKTDEVMTLPEQVMQIHYVPKPKKYNKFCKDLVVELESETLLGDTQLTQLLGKRKLCGVYSDEKLLALKDLLDSTSDRVVVFYNFWAELEAMKRIIGDRPHCAINSSTHDLSVFEENSDAVLFAQYQSASAGLNLQAANRIIYFTPPLSSAHYEQSKKRIHRIGQNKTCFYHNLICEQTVEEDIYKMLDERRDYTDRLFTEVNQ